MNGGYLRIQRRERLSDTLRKDGSYRVFRWKMSRIYQRQPKRLGPLHDIIRTITNYKRLRTLFQCKIHQLAARTAANCYTQNFPAAVRKTYTACMKRMFDKRCKSSRLHCVRQYADPSQQPLLSRAHRDNIPQAKRRR